MSTQGIRQSTDHPWYWEFRGTPTLLLGGSDEDNPFQWTGAQLTDQLDLMVSVGANYIRNTLSDRDPGNVRAWEYDGSRYYLDRWNSEYWDRLQCFLEETARRDIVVHLTLWDQHDFSGTKWDNHPLNPVHNQIGLEESALHCPRDLFDSVRTRNALVLPYLNKFVANVLSHSLPFDHVLYNISNEGWAGIEWERYWARYIHRRAGEQGVSVQVTNMLHGPEMSVDTVIDDPDLFSFVEVSQNNNASTGHDGRQHWEELIRYRARTAAAIGPRPFNNVKIYGSPNVSKNSMGSADLAVRKFWQTLFAGCASARFHRPDCGLGLGPVAQRTIRAARMLQKRFDILSSVPGEPCPDDDSCERYTLRRPNGDLAIYLPEGGQIRDLVDEFDENGTVTWIDAAASPATPEVTHETTESITAHGTGSWVAIINPTITASPNTHAGEVALANTP